MKKKIKKVNAAILIIGDEILSGRTQDLNVSFISKWLNDNCGIIVEEVRVIQDVELIIVKTIKELSKKFNYVFTTGGIGPTHDDITAKSISKAFGVKYQFHNKAYKILENYYGKKNFNSGRKKMAKMPHGSTLVLNPSSAAPGFKIKNVICLPGVPSILKSMIENCNKFLTKGNKKISQTINAETVESNISKELGNIQNKYKKHVSIGSYPFFRLGKVGVSLVLRSTNRSILNKCSNNLKNILKLKDIKLFKYNLIK
jgi:molybdenum cofactor synthesis domain-containing protein